MVLDALSNFVRGRVDAAVGSSDTTVSVADAEVFPDPATDGEFNVVMWNANNFPRPDQDGDVEIMRVTATDTTADELTVVRGQEGTAAAAHPSGSAVHLSPTAKMFGDIESTFADFWDSGTQELTADVNNESVSTGEINTIVHIRGDSGKDIQDAIDQHGENTRYVIHNTGEAYTIDNLEDVIEPVSNTQYVGKDNPIIRAMTSAGRLMAPVGRRESTPGEEITTNVLVQGIEFDGNGQTNDNLRVESSSDWTIRDVYSHNAGSRMGLEIQLSQDVRVVNCTFSENGDDGLSVTDTGFGGESRTRNVRVSNCASFNNEDAGFEIDDGPAYVLVSGCYSQNDSQKSFVVHTHGGELQPCHITFDSCVVFSDDGTNQQGPRVGPPWGGDKPAEFDQNNISFRDIKVIGEFDRNVFEINTSGSGESVSGVRLNGFDAEIMDTGSAWSDAIRLRGRIENLSIKNVNMDFHESADVTHGCQYFGSDNENERFLENVTFADWVVSGGPSALRIVLGADSTTDDYLKNISIRNITALDCWEDGIAVMVNSSAPRIENIKLDGCTVSTNDGRPIRIEQDQNCEGVWVRNCTVPKSSSGFGLQVTDSAEIFVKHNIVKEGSILIDRNDDGFVTENIGSVSSSDNTNVTIRDNI